MTDLVETPPPAPSLRSRRPWIMAALALLLLVMYSFGLHMAQDEVEFDALELAAGPRGQDFVDVQSTVMTLDPISGTMMARLDFEPMGAYSKGQGLLSRALTLRVNNSRGPRQITFPAGHPMNSVEVELDLIGSTADYPFDVHTSTLEFLFVEGPERTPIPLAFHLDAVVTGYDLKGAVEDPGDPTWEEVELEVRRTPSVRYYAIAMLSVMGALAGAVVTVVSVFYVQRRKVEATLFGFMAPMLFAFPAMRHTMPGVPPVGSLCDYAVFFWAEGIVALSVLAGVYCWAFLPPNREVR